jgi:hypothetical protein
MRTGVRRESISVKLTVPGAWRGVEDCGPAQYMDRDRADLDLS